LAFHLSPDEFIDAQIQLNNLGFNMTARKTLASPIRFSSTIRTGMSLNLRPTMVKTDLPLRRQ
jgi:hypothetical protein